MRTLTMTADQTQTYDSGSEQEQVELMRALRREAQALADRTGRAVEIATSDGVTVCAVDAER